VVHYVCPRIEYTDRGKSAILLSTEPADVLRRLTTAVTKKWAKYRKAQDKSYRERSFYVRRRAMTIREAAFEVMQSAYMEASDDGKLPASPRQIFYKARPKILARVDDIEENRLDGKYFSQTLLPDYMELHDCDAWDIVWDARGTFSEPHTGKSIGIGTIEVRRYLGERPGFGGDVSVSISDYSTFDTSGPENRYRTVLFIEKEGFWPVIEASGLAERYDLALMSTKGMSTTAARHLLDRLIERGVRLVLVLHDFDISGFSILGTIGANGRRYVFKNKLPIVDLGLRLSDAQEMGLESEPPDKKRDSKTWAATAKTLARHGATPEEIAFLKDARIELNAMSSREFVNFLERKFTELGITKVIPDDDLLERHARRVIQQNIAESAIARIRHQIVHEIAEETAQIRLPDDLRGQLEAELTANPQLPWDVALASIISGYRS
jgi:hypothetical protein